MTSAAITLLGLGPGSINDLTRQGYALLEQAATTQQTEPLVYFRTLIHPTVEQLQQLLPTLHIESFDQLYDESDDWSTLYNKIAEEVCTRAVRQPIIYAVPGHPLIAETSVQLILQLARERNLSTAIVAGLSFLEPVCAALDLDPFAKDLQLVDATSLAALGEDELAGKIIPTTPLLVAQVYNRRLASAVKLALSEFYPDEWPVKMVRAAGIGGEETVMEVPLYELDRSSFANHLTTLYIPPVGEMSALRLPETLRYITMRLRRDPDGCPWDRQQTHHSLTRYVIEETYEVVEALEEGNMEKLAEELGDLLLQVYLHSEIARQDGDFSIGDVFEHVNAKLIRRHPHVFGSVEVENAGQVVQNWETIKREERARAGKDVQQESVLDGVPLALPALMVAQEYLKRAARIGFYFRKPEHLYQKIEEELQELREANTPEELRDEMGDVLFTVSCLAFWHKLDAEEVLRASNRKFKKRFQQVERQIRERELDAPTLDMEDWRALWREAKQALQ